MMGGAAALSGWTCLFANDFDPKKAASYALNWGDDHLKVGDLAAVTTADLQGAADLAWASFPCQDLSLAGAGAGLKGERSGTFWPFWKLMKKLGAEGRAPRLIALDNVCGAPPLTVARISQQSVLRCPGSDYRFGAVVTDAVDFVPQSRPRLFIIGVHKSLAVPAHLVSAGPDPDGIRRL